MDRHCELELIVSLGVALSGTRSSSVAANTEPWSNGQTEGQITPDEGRPKVDLLQDPADRRQLVANVIGVVRA